jgi:hypothetical protein
VPAVAIATVAIAATTAALSLVHFVEKPSGVRLLGGDPPVSVWHMDRWQVQSILRAEMTPVFEFVEKRIPADATVALALREDDFGYPPFGTGLERRVELVPLGDASGVDADWLVASPEHAPAIGTACWDAEVESAEGWTIFRGAC